MAKGKLKLPKKFAGMRVPKTIRKLGTDVLANPWLGNSLPRLWFTPLQDSCAIRVNRARRPVML